MTSIWTETGWAVHKWSVTEYSIHKFFLRITLADFFSKVRISMRVYFFLQGNKRSKNNKSGMKALKGAVKVNISKYSVHRSS